MLKTDTSRVSFKYPRVKVDKRHWLYPHILGYYPTFWGEGSRVRDFSNWQRPGNWTTNAVQTVFDPDIGLAYNGTGSSGQYFDVGTWNTNTTAVTLSCWVYLNATSNDLRFIAKATGTSAAAHVWMLGTTGTSWRIRMEDQGFGVETLVAGTASTGTWFHVVGMYDPNQANEMRLFVDGANVGAASHGSALVNDSAATIRILGTVGGGDTEYLDGYLAHPLMINRGLTDRECAAFYQEGPNALLTYERRIWAKPPAAVGGDPEGNLIGGKLTRRGLLVKGRLV